MPTAFRVTVKDLEALPKWEGIRYEIIDGELYVTNHPPVYHQHVIGSLGYAFYRWDERHTLGECVSSAGLELAPDQDVIPDFVWVTNERLASSLNDAGHLTTAPELVAEVMMPGPIHVCRDRVVKLNLYSRYGVDEYWIVDWKQHQVEVYRRADGDLQLFETLTDKDVLTSPLLPGFECRIASLWMPGHH